MQKKYFYNSIISFVLIVSTILTPLSFIPRKAEAQFGGGIAGYTSGLAAGIAVLPQCGASKLVGSGINSLFNGISHLFSSIPTDNEAEEIIKNLSGDSLT